MDKLEEKIKSLLAQMTVEEKISFADGDDAWHAPSLARLGIPQIMKCDGPHGLRKRSTDKDGNPCTVEATCFPPAALLADSWDPDLAGEVGGAIAEECRAEKVSMLLGPGVNIKRSPLCGRNFEYYSEDPYLAGKMGAGLIRGVQAKGVAACVKHFCANNQETRRFSASSEVSERALHEIYLPAFEAAVKEANVQAVMHGYNRLNGSYVGENRELLTETLREKWGFDGYVMSDWNAISDRTAAYKAGTDVEMQPSFGIRDRELLRAYKEGKITMEEIDRSVAHVLRVIYRHLPAKGKVVFDKAAHHALAVRAAQESMVLLKNEKNVLPLASGEKLAVIGGFAKVARFQGGGSSRVNTPGCKVILDEITARCGGEVRYADGYPENHTVDEKLIREAAKLAKECGRAVLFVGMPESYETEGRDRRHMHLPEGDDRLVEAVMRVCKNVAVVLIGGSPMELPWEKKVPAILYASLGGEGVAEAVTALLFGDANPCGKLAETHPLRLEDNPSYPYFPGDGDRVFYGEDIYVGYRWYDKRKMEVLFPFGHGLSYTHFAYTGIRTDGKTVTVTVKNDGCRAGKETVQLYVRSLPHPLTAHCVSNSSYGFARPVRELAGFQKVALEAGEETEVTFALTDRMFSVWDVDLHDFRRLSGSYLLEVGGSSRDLPLSVQTEIGEDGRFLPRITANTTFEDLLCDSRIPDAAVEEVLRALWMPKTIEEIHAEGDFRANALKKRRDATLRQYIVYSGGKFDDAALDALLIRVNAMIG